MKPGPMLRRARAAVLPLLLVCYGCVRPQSKAGAPPARIEAPTERPTPGSSGRTLTFPIPSELHRDAEYVLVGCRGACGSNDKDEVVVRVQLERAVARRCVPLREPEQVAPQDDDLPEQMLNAENGDAEEPHGARASGGPQILERGTTELLGMSGERIAYRHPQTDSGPGRCVFRAVASRIDPGPKRDRRNSCLVVDYTATRERSGDLAAFRAILASLGKHPPPAPPAGFTRFPFGDAQLDLPDGLPFHRIALAGVGGSIAVRNASDQVPVDLAAWLSRNHEQAAVQALERHTSEPLLNGTLERARVLRP